MDDDDEEEVDDGGFSADNKSGILMVDDTKKKLVSKDDIDFQLSHYSKKKILELMQNTNIDPAQRVKTLKYFANPKRKKSAVEFVQTTVNKTENRVREKYDSQILSNSINWIEYLKHEGAKSDCNFEIPLLLKMISDTELHPDVEMANGIDFKQLYTTFADMLMGYPIRELNDETKDFLMKMYYDLMQKVTNGDFQNDIEIFQNIIDKSISQSVTDNGSPDKPTKALSTTNMINAGTSSDSVTPDYEKHLERIFTDKGLNPLQIPFNNLKDKKI